MLLLRRSLSYRNGGTKNPTESRQSYEVCISALRFLYPGSVPSAVAMSPILEAGVHKSKPLLADLSSCPNPNVCPLINYHQSTFSALKQIQVLKSREYREYHMSCHLYHALSSASDSTFVFESEGPHRKTLLAALSFSSHPSYHPGRIDLYHSPIPALKPTQVFDSEAHHVQAERRKELWGQEDTISDIFLLEYEPRKDPELPSIQSPGPEVSPGKIPNEFPYAVDPTYDPPGAPEIPMPATPEPEVPELPCDKVPSVIEPEYDLPGAPELPSREF